MRKINYKIIINCVFPLTLGVFILLNLYQVALADSVQIENTIQSISNTGNSTNSNEGKSYSEIKTKTIINGQTIQDINKKSEGNNAQIEIKTIYQNGSTTSQFDLGAGSQEELNRYDEKTIQSLREKLTIIINLLKAYVFGIF